MNNKTQLICFMNNAYGCILETKKILFSCPCMSEKYMIAIPAEMKEDKPWIVKEEFEKIFDKFQRCIVIEDCEDMYLKMQNMINELKELKKNSKQQKEEEQKNEKKQNIISKHINHVHTKLLKVCDSAEAIPLIHDISYPKNVSCSHQVEIVSLLNEIKSGQIQSFGFRKKAHKISFQNKSRPSLRTSTQSNSSGGGSVEEESLKKKTVIDSGGISKWRWDQQFFLLLSMYFIKYPPRLNTSSSQTSSLSLIDSLFIHQTNQEIEKKKNSILKPMTKTIHHTPSIISAPLWIRELNTADIYHQTNTLQTRGPKCPSNFGISLFYSDLVTHSSENKYLDIRGLIKKPNGSRQFILLRESSVIENKSSLVYIKDNDEIIPLPALFLIVQWCWINKTPFPSCYYRLFSSSAEATTFDPEIAVSLKDIIFKYQQEKHLIQFPDDFTSLLKNNQSFGLFFICFWRMLYFIQKI